MTYIHVSEQYRCDRCGLVFNYIDVNISWLCKNCSIPVSIKIVNREGNFSCYRLHPSEIRNGQLISEDGRFFYEVITNSHEGESYRIALRGYGIIKPNKNNFLLVIHGGWHDDPQI
jgi:DNA-directed RNA polymerase subunit RPC12/RpoP